MAETQIYTTEVHEASKTLEGIKEVHTNSENTLKQLQEKAKKAKETVDTLINDAIKTETVQDKRTAKITALQKKVDEAVALEKDNDHLKKLLDDKKNLNTTYVTALEKEFDKVIALTTLTEGEQKDTTENTTNQEVKTPDVEKKKQDAENNKKKEFARRVKFLEDLKDTKVQDYMKLIANTNLKDAPIHNTVMSDLLKSIADVGKKATVQAALNTLNKGVQDPSVDGEKRANFMRIMRENRADEKNPSDEQMLAAENLWRVRMNKDRGTDGKRAPLSVEKMWPMLTLADIQKASTPLPKEEQQEVNEEEKVEDKKDANGNSTPAPAPAPKPEENSNLEWSDANKEKIVTAVITEALSSLQKVTSVDFSAGKSLEFTANGKKCILNAESFTCGDKSVKFTLMGNSAFTLFGDRNLPIKQLNYQSATDASLIVDAKVLGGESSHAAAMKGKELKRFITAVMGAAHADAAAEKNIPIPVDKATVHLQIS